MSLTVLIYVHLLQNRFVVFVDSEPFFTVRGEKTFFKFSMFSC